MNATYLFEQPRRNFHNSESFWTSLFAILLLDASRRNSSLRIPVYAYDEAPSAGRMTWAFTEVKDAAITLPELEFADIVVEGEIGLEFLEYRLKEDFHRIPKERMNEFKHTFGSLRPDMIVLMDDRLLIIEAKTIGADISYKEDKYEVLCEWLREFSKIRAEPYLLISAGHERASQVRALKRKPRIILWEPLLMVLIAGRTDAIATRIGLDLRPYCEAEGLFSGEWTTSRAPARRGENS